MLPLFCVSYDVALNYRDSRGLPALKYVQLLKIESWHATNLTAKT